MSKSRLDRWYKEDNQQAWLINVVEITELIFIYNYLFVLCDEIGTSGSETVQGKSHLDRFLQSKSAGVTEKCSGNYTNEQTGWNFFSFALLKVG